MKALDDYNAAIEAVKEAFGLSLIDTICDMRTAVWRCGDHSFSWGDDFEYSAERHRASKLIPSLCCEYVGISGTCDGYRDFYIFAVCNRVS